MIRLLLLDIEGVLTLPGGSQYPWPLEALLEVRRRLADAPIACGLCTGRPAPYVEAMCQALGLHRSLPTDLLGRGFLSWPSIAENGAYFYDPLAKTALPHPALESGSLGERMKAIRAALTALVRESGATLEPGKDFSLSLNPPPVSPGSPERQSTGSFLPHVLRVLAPYQAQIEVKHSASAIDITPRGVSKASAVRHLMERLGLARDEVAGVGDTVADADWLQLVGWSAAPANGREALPGLDFYASGECTAGVLEIAGRLLGRC